MTELVREWLSPKDVAGLLGLSLSSVRGLIRDGRLPARRLRGSRLIRIARANLDVLLEPLAPRAAAKTSGRLRVVTTPGHNER
jgi:excisionase family DNA binding protein